MGVVESASPFRHWVIDDWCKPVPYQRVSGWEASYDNDIEQGKRTTRNIPEAFRHIFAELRNFSTVDEWERITDLPLADDPEMHGGGLCTMLAGGWLQTHLDYAIHPTFTHMERRLNLIAFLHPEWRPEWGGQLLLADAMGKPVVEIDPLPGRLVAFECGDDSFHGVRQLSHEAMPRVSAAVYYLSPARPGAVRKRAMYFPNRNAGKCPQEVR
jgi:hypothetical protein